MATKTSAAPKKAAAKKAPAKNKPAEPVVVESVKVTGYPRGAELEINGVKHTLTSDAFIALRGQINDQAAALVL